MPTTCQTLSKIIMEGSGGCTCRPSQAPSQRRSTTCDNTLTVCNSGHDTKFHRTGNIATSKKSSSNFATKLLNGIFAAFFCIINSYEFNRSIVAALIVPLTASVSCVRCTSRDGSRTYAHLRSLAIAATTLGTDMKSRRK